MEDRELRLAAGRFTQLAVAQMNTDFCLNMPTHHNAHERSRYSEHRRMADPVDPYLGQQCEPAESKLSEPVDPYSFENPYWGQPSCDNDVSENPSWSPTPTPRPDTFIAHTTPPDIPIAEQRANDKKDGGPAPEIKKRTSKRRKRSTFTTHTGSDDKEQRRIAHIVKNLQIFENQQKMYGRQQLKAIKDGIA
ncbi:hypothetical protein Trisim1_006620 [Trichoderma cf. simile WF8]